MFVGKYWGINNDVVSHGKKKSIILFHIYSIIMSLGFYIDYNIIYLDIFKVIPIRLIMLNLHYILLIHLYILYDCVYFLISILTRNVFFTNPTSTT